MRRLRVLLVLGLVFCAETRAQSGGGRSGLILVLPTSPRALGLGEASAGAVPDAWTTFAAPAQLPRLEGVSAALASEAYLVSTQLSAAAFTLPLRRGTLGIGMTQLDYGSIKEIASTAPGTDGSETGKTFSAQDNAFVISYGTRVDWVEGMTLGASAEVVTSRIADLSATGFAMSAGLGWASRNGWDVALGAQHLGPDMTLGSTSGALPATLRAAVAAPARKISTMFLRPLAEVRVTRGGNALAVIAGEAEWSSANGAAFQLRGGYQSRSDSEDDRWPVALGVGLVLGSWAIDYAPERFRTIEQTTHRFGVRYARRPAAPK